ncbi:MAG TPA: multiheme c-type cytochrome [Candidatus Didemnitutus sp.]|nr:multiheme c-type cytochrome [Candidatus Didemnitutus sp.]
MQSPPRRSDLLRACARLGMSLVLGAALGKAGFGAIENPASVTFQLPGARTAATYVGDAACASCHADKAATFRATAHAQTSQLATAESIHGRFAEGANVMRTVNPDLYFVMEAKDHAFWQTAIKRTSATQVMTRSEQIDIVIGSGRKGQTYLYWNGDDVFQLPVSYWTSINDWVNSPGYRDGTANFERPIGPRCFECHASRFESRAPPENRFDRASMVLGISCEKCHGPGSEHVARHQTTGVVATGDSAIINPARLSRERRMDVCGLCHAGSGTSLTPALSYVPGDVLANHLLFPPPAPDAPADPHANQIKLLSDSRCFRESTTLTCNTCHDVHQQQRDATAFVRHCLECHQVTSCRLFPERGQAIATGCVECHMPLQQTQKIVSSARGLTMQPKIRSHRIAIYPKEGGP